MGKINIEKSKKFNQLFISRNKLDFLFYILVAAFVIFILPVSSLIYMIRNSSSLEDDVFGQIMSNLLAISFSIFIYNYLFKPKKILRLSGINKIRNKEIVLA